MSSFDPWSFEFTSTNASVKFLPVKIERATNSQ